MLHVTQSVHVGMKWQAMTYALHLCTGHHVESGVSAWLGSTQRFLFDHGKSTLCLVFDGGLDGSTPFRSNLIGGSEPDPGCFVTTISLYQNHLSKTRSSDFNLGQAYKHLQIQCNSFTKYAFNQKWHFMPFTT